MYLSTRRGSWILNRVGLDGRPIDLLYTNAISAALQRYAPGVLNWVLERELNKKFNHELYNLKPKHRPSRKSFVQYDYRYQ